ncbi:hypothetical protein AGMMS49593_01720 [Endomicrobiia bacterium]|nr:hypothetical protein AGMMS49593_01720 [Endomicrobiia bacterium]
MITINGTATISNDFDVSTSKTVNPFIRLSLMAKTSKKGLMAKVTYGSFYSIY